MAVIAHGFSQYKNNVQERYAKIFVAKPKYCPRLLVSGVKMPNCWRNRINPTANNDKFNYICI